MSKPAVKVRYYRLKNKLKEKTAGLALEPGAIIEFDEDVLADAEDAFQEMAEEYPDWVMGLINELFEIFRRCVDDDVNRKGYFERINAIAHDMRGQGGTFGYQLITDFAEGLYNFTQRGSGLSDSHVEIIKAHLDAMRVVIRDRVEGDGGDIGKALKEGLEESVKRYSNKK
ncbi:hypothetical protein [Pseudemcibacter aquimaris]|uniref:hypothetical protein n=1 Tax=Pseudemcibacter aquimaris TaxID=2857064 RepID=UPI00201134EF|nr:hypothetical protein [Pseudemcibacter aquimaris]MCC3860795.1 hypothetical protein [Pseudemcibacter aquimaris]WDU59615.1 hypothetical protein KW060_04990 [Pseudemcibacter aquimaris]